MTITQHTRRRVVEAIPAEGAPLRELAAISGVHISNVRTIAKLLAEEGRIFIARAPTGENNKAEVWAFTEEAKREAFAALQEDLRRQKAIMRSHAQAAERKAQRATLEHRSAVSIAAERREEARRLARDAKEAREQRDRAQKVSLRNRLKAQTAAAGELSFKAGTLSPKPAKGAWADMPADIPDGLAPVELPNNLRGRFDTQPEDVPQLFSSLRPGQYIAPAPAWVQAATA